MYEVLPSSVPTLFCSPKHFQSPFVYCDHWRERSKCNKYGGGSICLHKQVRGQCNNAYISTCGDRSTRKGRERV